MSRRDLPPEDDLFAAELAFGLLDRDARLAGEGRLASDAAFAERHDDWLGYAVALTGAQPEAPDPRLWDRIQAQLPANDPARGLAAQRSLRRWQAAAVAASIIAALSLGVAALRPAHAPVVQQAPPPPRPVPVAPLVATLTGADRHASLAVSYVVETGRFTLQPNAVEAGGRAAELWVIPAGAKPRAIGVVAAHRPSLAIVPPERRGDIVPGATLALSLEPAGGSPTGQPTGPVILTGKITEPS